MTPDWSALAYEFDPDLVGWCREKLDVPGHVELTPSLVASYTDCDEAEVDALLARLEQQSFVARETRFECPCCAEGLDPEDAAGSICPHCGAAYVDCGRGVRATTVYVRDNRPGRSVPWVLVVHGMNTPGAWQERFAWLAATTYTAAVPVFVYKYGLVRVGVLFRRRQRYYVRQLARRIATLSEAYADRLGARPDVLAHSFGTWLVGRVMEANPDLRIGRVVLTGSILRPDFDWQRLVARGQVEAVLNHFGTRDRPVRLAQYLIWDSGPSGRYGFDEESGVVNHGTRGLTHTGFFSDDVIGQFYADVWRPFLTRDPSEHGRLSTGAPRPWRPPPWILRATLPRYGVIAALACLVAGMGWIVVAGTIDIVSRIG